MTSSLRPPANPRYLALDVWRGLACLMIVVLHAVHYAEDDKLSGGVVVEIIRFVLGKLGVGVPIFFVISGYCIAATSDSARRKPSAPASFFYRRFRRIFPPYWAILLISILLVVVLSALGQANLISDEYGSHPLPIDLTWSQWLGNITLTETWRFHLFGDPDKKIVGPSWTLCYEEQFYAVCGLILILMPRHFFLGIALVSVATCFVAPFALIAGRGSVRGFFFDGRWLMFALGVLVYYLLNYTSSRWVGIYLLIGIVLFFTTIRWGLSPVAADGLLRNRALEMVASTVFALSLVLLHPWDRQIAESRILYPVRLCGTMCYSLYLVHWPITIIMANVMVEVGVCGFWPTLLLTGPLAIIASIAASWLFYISIERRFLNTRNLS